MCTFCFDVVVWSPKVYLWDIYILKPYLPLRMSKEVAVADCSKSDFLLKLVTFDSSLWYFITTDLPINLQVRSKAFLWFLRNVANSVETEVLHNTDIVRVYKCPGDSIQHFGVNEVVVRSKVKNIDAWHSQSHHSFADERWSTVWKVRGRTILCGGVCVRWFILTPIHRWTFINDTPVSAYNCKAST